ncbi:GNAT family N-acetyltransferase [Streptomyces libani]|uniref:GNAT family N-acetyltransferase n=1 Tax=Streptomyces nigrescens TaxID=1920 RepID=UPI00362E5222
MPYLVPPCIPPGSLAALDQPSVPVKGGLLLRPWRQTDAAALAAAFTDPGIQRWHVRRIDSEEEARGWITRCQERWQAETGVQIREDRPAAV